MISTLTQLLPIFVNCRKMCLRVRSVLKKTKSERVWPWNSPPGVFLEEEGQSTCTWSNEVNTSRTSTLCSRLDADILKERKIRVVLMISMSTLNTHFQLASNVNGEIETVW